jgi:hypothetical protein
MTSDTGKKSQKELTMRGGPGNAGVRSGTKRTTTASKRSPTRGRGGKARAGA